MLSTVLLQLLFCCLLLRQYHPSNLLQYMSLFNIFSSKFTFNFLVPLSMLLSCFSALLTFLPTELSHRWLPLLTSSFGSYTVMSVSISYPTFPAPVIPILIILSEKNFHPPIYLIHSICLATPAFAFSHSFPSTPLQNIMRSHFISVYSIPFLLVSFITSSFI